MANTETSLAIFTKASQMLAEADTIQKAKELKDLALTAKDWAKRKGMGEEAIRHCHRYSKRAEIRMGEMLLATERAKPPSGKGQKKTDRRLHDDTDGDEPTLAELGISKRESAEAQKLAQLEEELQISVIEDEKSLSEIKKEQSKKEKEAKRAALAKKGSKVTKNERAIVEEGDIRTYQTSRQFDYIITDPPYKKEYVELYGVLAERAKEWLVPGGMVIAMCGETYLDQIYGLMSEHLEYYWTGCYLTEGQPTPQRQRNVNTTWKPLLFYHRKGDKYTGKIFGDVFRSDAKDKSKHEWGQSESGMLSIVSKVCDPGHIIFDPFLGAGTTGVAALEHKCLFHGIDTDKECVLLSRGRLERL